MRRIVRTRLTQCRAQPPYPSVEIAGVQAAVGVLSSKWSVAILAELAGGTRRFNELLRTIDGISRRMLAATLRRLEQDGLIERRVYADVPVRVEYDLSPRRRALRRARPALGLGAAAPPRRGLGSDGHPEDFGSDP